MKDRARAQAERAEQDTRGTDGSRKMREVQLYWDDQDGQEAGWTLRWRDARGELHHRPIDGDETAAAADLAVSVEGVLAHGDLIGADATIPIVRADARRGRIVVEDGEITSWREQD